MLIYFIFCLCTFKSKKEDYVVRIGNKEYSFKRISDNKFKIQGAIIKVVKLKKVKKHTSCSKDFIEQLIVTEDSYSDESSEDKAKLKRSKKRLFKPTNAIKKPCKIKNRKNYNKSDMDKEIYSHLKDKESSGSRYYSDQPVNYPKLAYKVSSKPKEKESIKILPNNSKEEISETDFYSCKNASGNLDFEAVYKKMEKNFSKYVIEAKNNSNNKIILNEIKDKVNKHIRFLNSELKGYDVYLHSGQINEELFNKLSNMDNEFYKFRENLTKLIG